MLDEVGEMGENISQKGDCYTGVQKFMVANDTRAQVGNSFKDNHVIVLGFIATAGEAVMCAIIIADSMLKVTAVTGFNPLSEDCGDYTLLFNTIVYCCRSLGYVDTHTQWSLRC
jgi:hypothetical protein